MKDFTLSEVKAHCKARVGKYPFPCKGCEMEVVCKSTLPVGWDIEPRDMIELPCKEHFVYEHDGGHVTENWRVFYRAGYAFIGTAVFDTEREADAFLADLKGVKNGN